MRVPRFKRIILPISVFLLLHFRAEAAALSIHPPPLGHLIDIGGYRLHLYCTGTGSPTVMIVGGGFSFDWGLVQPSVASFTHVCTYDPSGTAWSDPFPRTKTKNDSAEPTQEIPTCSERVKEIHKLLESAAVNGPYVLVGFSIGGLFARLYAHSYPEEVAGMVLVDHAFIDPGKTVKPSVPTRSTPDSSSGSLRVGQVDRPPILISKTPIALGIEDDQNFRKLPLEDQALHTWAMASDSSHGRRSGGMCCYTSPGHKRSPVSTIQPASYRDQYQQ